MGKCIFDRVICWEIVLLNNMNKSYEKLLFLYFLSDYTSFKVIGQILLGNEHCQLNTYDKNITLINKKCSGPSLPLKKKKCIRFQITLL